jgi:hypothetical protein
VAKQEFWNSLPIIDDNSPSDTTHGHGFGKGYEPRDFKKDPLEMFAELSTNFKLIPKSEYSARCEEQKREQSSLVHIRNRADDGKPIPSLNQGAFPFCWSHSSTSAFMIARAVANLSYVPLSAFSVACPVKNYRNEGGWCGQSFKYMTDVGVASQKFWPQGMNNRSYHTQEMLGNAALHKITEGVYDVARQVWDQELTQDQIDTLLLSNVPMALDFNWWSHSVCGLAVVEVEPGDFGRVIWNSWGDSWSENGLAVLRGKKKLADGAVALFSTTPTLGV